MNMEEQLRHVYGHVMNIEDFVRSTGELFAQSDERWKAVARNRRADEAVYRERMPRVMAEFVAAGLAHLDALDMCRMDGESLKAAVTMLITLDMTKIDTSVLGAPYVRLMVRFLKGCVMLQRASQADAYSREHASAIVSQAARVFMADRVVNDYGVDPEIGGMLDSCREFVEDNGLMPAVDVAEAYVDIYARLMALES